MDKRFLLKISFEVSLFKKLKVKEMYSKNKSTQGSHADLIRKVKVLVNELSLMPAWLLEGRNEGNA